MNYILTAEELDKLERKASIEIEKFKKECRKNLTNFILNYSKVREVELNLRQLSAIDIMSIHYMPLLKEHNLEWIADRPDGRTNQ